jgi:hypothetical protein
MSDTVETEPRLAESEAEFDWGEQRLEPGPELPEIDFQPLIDGSDISKLTEFELRHLEKLPSNYETLRRWSQCPIITDRFGTDHIARRALRQRLHIAAGSDTPEGRAFDYYQANLDRNKLRRNSLNHLNLALYLVGDGLRSASLANSDISTALNEVIDEFERLNGRSREIAKKDYQTIDEHVADIRELEQDVAAVGAMIASIINRT